MPKIWLTLSVQGENVLLLLNPLKKEWSVSGPALSLLAVALNLLSVVTEISLLTSIMAPIKMFLIMMWIPICIVSALIVITGGTLLMTPTMAFARLLVLHLFLSFLIFVILTILVLRQP